MTSSTHLPIVKLSAAKPVSTRRLGYGAALLLSAACVNAIAVSSAIAEPIPETSVPSLYEVPLEANETLPGAADLMPETAPLELQTLVTQSVEVPSVEVYPVIVDPALAAAISNGELASETEAVPLMLTQIQGDTTETRPEFGAKGQTRWFLQAGAATEGDGESFGLLGGGVSYFFAKGHSVNLALNGLAFDLPDKDPVGINLDLLVRSHWIRGENWSIYIDGGAGIIVTSSRVPNEGSSFNFTPQIGLGTSINVNKKKDQRLLLGVRYHHISNANTFESNPGLDTYMGYVGMTFPIQ